MRSPARTFFGMGKPSSLDPRRASAAAGITWKLNGVWTVHLSRPSLTRPTSHPIPFWLPSDCEDGLHFERTAIAVCKMWELSKLTAPVLTGASSFGSCSNLGGLFSRLLSTNFAWTPAFSRKALVLISQSVSAVQPSDPNSLVYSPSSMGSIGLHLQIIKLASLYPQAPVKLRAVSS